MATKKAAAIRQQDQLDRIEQKLDAVIELLSKIQPAEKPKADAKKASPKK